MNTEPLQSGVRAYRKQRADVLALIYEGTKSKQTVRAWLTCAIDERLTGSGDSMHTLEIQPVPPHGEWVPVMQGDYIVLDAGEWKVLKPETFEKLYEQLAMPEHESELVQLLVDWWRDPDNPPPGVMAVVEDAERRATA